MQPEGWQDAGPGAYDYRLRAADWGYWRELRCAGAVWAGSDLTEREHSGNSAVRQWRQRSRVRGRRITSRMQVSRRTLPSHPDNAPAAFAAICAASDAPSAAPAVGPLALRAVCGRASGQIDSSWQHGGSIRRGQFGVTRCVPAGKPGRPGHLSPLDGARRTKRTHCHKGGYRSRLKTDLRQQ